MILSMMLLLVFFFSCTENENHVLGGGSELPEVAIHVIETTGEPAAFSELSLYEGEWSPDWGKSKPFLKVKLSADSLGRIFKDFEHDVYNDSNSSLIPKFALVYNKDSSEVALWDFINSASDTLILKTAQSIFIKNNKYYSEVSLSGTPFVAKENPIDNNQLSIEGLPEGYYNLIDEKGKQISVPVSSVNPKPDSIELVELLEVPRLTDSLLIWDFETESNMNLLKGVTWTELDSFTNHGQWYYNGPNTVLVDDRWGVQLDSAGWDKFLFGKENDFHDLSFMNALELVIKGSGKLIVVFKSSALDSTQGNLSSTVELDNEEYKSLRITPAMIWPGATSWAGINKIGWEDIRHSIGRVDFFIKEGGPFYIDEIRLLGVNRTDLQKF